MTRRYRSNWEFFCNEISFKCVSPFIKVPELYPEEIGVNGNVFSNVNSFN